MRVVDDRSYRLVKQQLQQFKLIRFKSENLEIFTHAAHMGKSFAFLQGLQFQKIAGANHLIMIDLLTVFGCNLDPLGKNIHHIRFLFR